MVLVFRSAETRWARSCTQTRSPVTAGTTTLSNRSSSGTSAFLSRFLYSQMLMRRFVMSHLEASWAPTSSASRSATRRSLTRRSTATTSSMRQGARLWRLLLYVPFIVIIEMEPRADGCCGLIVPGRCLRDLRLGQHGPRRRVHWLGRCSLDVLPARRRRHSSLRPRKFPVPFQLFQRQQDSPFPCRPPPHPTA